MLWVFAALACRLNDGEPTPNGHLVGAGDDTATDVDDDTATAVDDSAIDSGDSAIDADADGYDATVDCDDQRPRVHPDATETCGNGRDDNCDGSADGCEWSGEYVLEGNQIYGTDRWSSIGNTLALCDANGDGISDVVVGAPFAGTGAVYVFYGPISTDLGTYNADHALIGTAKGLWTGFSLDCRRDVDGDGLVDIIVGEPGRMVVGHDPGTVYVVSGGGTAELPIADEATSTWIGSDAGDRLGSQVVAIDTDGDETDELAVTIAHTHHHPEAFGATYLFEDADPGARDADAAEAYFYGEQGDRLDGTAGNAGDLDGDGLEELALSGNGPDVEEVLVFRPPFAGAVPKSDADVRIVGGPRGSAFWSGIGHADLDDDGRDDLFVANPTHDPDGEVYAFFSPIDSDTRLAAADIILATTAWGSVVAVTSPGDVNGDGTADLLVGSAWADVVYLHCGEGSGVYDLANDAQASWKNEVFFEHSTLAGTTVAAGDVTGDGIGDFVIGAPDYGNFGEGAVTIIASVQL